MVKRGLVSFGRSHSVYALLNSVFKSFMKVASDEVAVYSQPFHARAGWGEFSLGFLRDCGRWKES